MPDVSSSAFTELRPPLIGALLRYPWDIVRGRLLDEVRDRGFADFDQSHLPVFLYPGPQGRRPSELAAASRMSKQAMNYVLGDLERLGYLVRRPDPADGRARQVHLTERGEALVRTVRAVAQEVHDEWSAAMGQARFQELCALLVELREIAAHRS